MRASGIPIQRHTDICTPNNGNCPGEYIHVQSTETTPAPDGRDEQDKAWYERAWDWTGDRLNEAGEALAEFDENNGRYWNETGRFSGAKSAHVQAVDAWLKKLSLRVGSAGELRRLTMERKPELPKEIRAEIDSLRAEAGGLFKNKRIDESISAIVAAWNLIPEPKSYWDYYPQSLSISLVKRYVILNDKESAKKWIAVMAEMYDDPNHEDHLVLMTEGEAMYRLGDLHRAYYVFGRIYEIYGRKGFAGEQLEYLDFYLKRKAAAGQE